MIDWFSDHPKISSAITTGIIMGVFNIFQSKAQETESVDMCTDTVTTVIKYYEGK